jgi:glycosyltransferase involved in cell wall biosynthesis
VISKWLYGIVKSTTKQDTIHITNPIDLDTYKIINPIEDRPQYSLSVLYHTKKNKGFVYALECINKLKAIFPDLRVEMFGAYSKRPNLPDWVHYTANASQEETVQIYNSVSVFICASLEEGFGLTGMEAMACGDVLISSDYEGVFEYAKHNFNALISHVKDVDQMVNNVSYIFNNPDARKQIVKNAQKSLIDHDWERAIDNLENVVLRDNL